MSPTPRAALVLAAIALCALALPPALVALAAVALGAAVAVDALAVRRRPRLDRTLPQVLARGVPAKLEVQAGAAGGGALRVRQPSVPDVLVEPREGDGGLEARVVGRRRGRHSFPGVAARAVGPLGLGAWYHPAGEARELRVYPDLPAARRLALAVRLGRFREQGMLPRGPLGLGTEFESVRDYQPDDDIRQVNWRATARLGRPMSNDYRLERDREVLCLVDAGRLMAAPLGDRTRLDAAVDAAVAVALVADALGDRCGAVAFDDEIRRRLPPRRAGGEAVVEALYDIEPRPVESDYELAFQALEGAKRSLVILLTDLLDEAAARSMLDAVPVLARRHAVVVASCSDPDLDALVRTEPADTADVYATAAALDLLDERAAVGARLRRAGADVVEAKPSALGAACVQVYLRAKARARL
ncbi:MAG: hypothetical protein QOH76_494 [Thermoleophilaceae bacterium]|nr:hypothetical protein [Thermoleophilaceae bacterium]